MEEADYIILGLGEEQHFDETWYSAQDFNKPIVKPEFVIDSCQKGRLLDPNDYPTKGPKKLRKDNQRKARSQPATGEKKKRGRGKGVTGLQPAPSAETPKWLRSFKEAEEVKSFRYIGAMFKKNPELTHDALAIYLHNKVRSLGLCVYTLAWRFLSRSIQMSNHTINSWKKYCLHREETIEDLCKKAIENAGERAIPRDEEMADATVTGADEKIAQIFPEVAFQQVNPQRSDSRQGEQQANPQQADSQHRAPEQTILQLATPQQAVPRQIAPPPTNPQPTIVQQTVPQHVTQPAVPQQVAPQVTVNQGPTPPRESQSPLPPYEKVAKPIQVKTEPVEAEELDFSFAAEVLSTWKPNEECDAELWKRMETTVFPLVFYPGREETDVLLSGPVPLPHHGEHSVKSIGFGLQSTLRINPLRREADPVFTP